MDNRSDGGGMAIAIALILVVMLLLLGGGAGVFVYIKRQQTSMIMQVEQLRMVEEQARVQAHVQAMLARDEAEARAAAERLSASDTSTNDISADNNPPSAATSDSIQVAVKSILRAQQEAWNRADLEAFMEHYWKSDELTFSSGGKTTRGWTDTLARYRERYPGPEKMGRLKLSGLEISSLGDSAALVLGEWSVERDSEPVSGNFSLVVRKLDDRWLIIHDHTSRLAE